MRTSDILGYIVFLAILGYCIYIYIDTSTSFQLKCIVSDVDGNKYCVRERKNMKNAADLLARVTQKGVQLVDFMNKKYPNDENVKRLVKNFNPKKITETLPNSSYTAYSENKGEKIAFCLNVKKEDDSHLIDEKTLTFVMIHELSHLMTSSIGHKSDFWNNFKFLLENAKECGVYQPEDYKKEPKEYCSTKIHDNPYFDL